MTKNDVEELAYTNGATALFFKAGCGDATGERDSRIVQSKVGTGLCLTRRTRQRKK